MEDELYAEAVMVTDGIISKVGNFEYVMKFKDDGTSMYDLKGRTLMPSFIDPHSHITAFATTLKIADLSRAKSFAEIVQLLKRFKEGKHLKADDWIMGFGYDHNQLEEGRHPDKSVLDEVSMDNPVLIAHASGHMGVVNSAALNAVGITPECRDPEGGVIGRAVGSSEPDGYLEEKAFISMSSNSQSATDDEMRSLMREAQKVYLSYGITTAQDGLVNEEEFHMLDVAACNGDLVMDVVGYVDMNKSKGLVEEHPEYLKGYRGGFRIGGYKVILDGSPQGRTAWLTRPYENAEDGYSGYPVYSNEKVKDFFRNALDESRQILVHCNGDAAADQYISAYRAALDEVGEEVNIRPVMIHAQTLRPDDQLDEVRELGIIPSYFIAHTYHWGDVHLKNLGEDRAFNISPAGTSEEKDTIYTFHQDTPVIPPDMLETVWCAVNRVSKDGVVMGEKQRVSVLQALRAVTVNAAYQYFEEDVKGSLKEGKIADMVVLDSNPLKVDPVDVKGIRVLATLKNGAVVYEA